MNRTVRVILKPTPEQAEALAETTRQFTGAFNLVCAHGWRERCKNGVTLHHVTYREARGAFKGLVSDLHIQARVKATEAVKSALALANKGRKVGCPASERCPPRYNTHTMAVDWPARTVRLSTVAGRQAISFHLPSYAARFDGAAVATADLIHRDGAWRLHIVVDLPPPAVEPTGHVIGVDLGLARPAVTSDADFLGERRWRGIEDRYFRHRRALQKAGTKSAKRRLRQIRGRQRRFRRDCDHVLSKRIVAAARPGDVIAMENLTDIRSRAKTRKGGPRRRLHGWSFAQLRSFTEYKAEERGCTVVGVDPRHTSQTCVCCGHIARNNRRSQALFKCRACGFTLNADLIGARNIAAKYRAVVGMPGDGEPHVNRLIVGERCLHRSTHKPPPSGGGS